MTSFRTSQKSIYCNFPTLGLGAYFPQFHVPPLGKDTNRCMFSQQKLARVYWLGWLLCFHCLLKNSLNDSKCKAGIFVLLSIYVLDYMSRDVRKTVFGISDQVRHKSACKVQGRRRRSGRSGHGRTTFLAENGFGRTTIFDYSAENVFAFSTFF